MSLCSCRRRALVKPKKINQSIFANNTKRSAAFQSTGRGEGVNARKYVSLIVKRFSRAKIETRIGSLFVRGKFCFSIIVLFLVQMVFVSVEYFIWKCNFLAMCIESINSRNAYTRFDMETERSSHSERK